MRTTLNIDDALMAKAKRRAQSRGVTLTCVLEDALAAYLAEGESDYRLDLPSWDFDGIHRGADVADRAALYDALDDRRTRRFFDDEPEEPEARR